MNPRPYQVEAKKAIFHRLADRPSTLLELATGLGKTCVFSWVANEWPGRVLVIAHREELIRQAAQKVHEITGDAVAVEMGTERAYNSLLSPKVTVASIQTLARANRLNRFHPDHFSLIVIDEGHHAAAKTYRSVLAYFPKAKKLFVTATPKRGDKIALRDVCESVAFQFGIELAITEGWLVPVRQSVVTINGLDFSKARTVAQDFNAADLERILTEEQPLHEMVASAHEIIGSRPALWFCVSVAHAQMLAAVLGRYVGKDRIKFLSGKTDPETRQKSVAEFKAGRIQHLLNCALFLEGFDAPATAAIVMCRPTKSLALYTQVLGRATRPLPGIVDGVETADGRRQAILESAKPDALVIDYCGNAGRHKIVQAIDVLGGTAQPNILDAARKLLSEEKDPMEVGAAIERAKAEDELLNEELNQRRQRIKAKASYQTRDVSLFARQHAEPQLNRARPQEDPCSRKQAGKIVWLGRRTGQHWEFGDALKLSKKQASGVIGKLMALEAKPL